LDDVTKWTVSRCEVKCGAAVIASSRMWFSIMEHDIFSLRPSGYSTSLIATRQDATHGRRKYAALELRAAYIAGVSTERQEDYSVNWQNFKYIQRVGDVLRIKDETVAGTMAFTKKVLKNLGAPTWESFSQKPFCYGAELFGQISFTNVILASCCVAFFIRRHQQMCTLLN